MSGGPLSEYERAWRAEAACAGLPPELWFPMDELEIDADDDVRGDGNHALEAKRICAECPVAVPCGVAAVLRGEMFGIWGGIGGSKLKWLRRLYEQRGNAAEIDDLMQAEVSALRGQQRAWQPKRKCERCGKMIPAGRWPPDRNSPGTSCASPVAYTKGARCWTARVSNSMRHLSS